MAFREVRVYEIREVLRLWLRGEGLRSIERLARVDRKTVRRYVEAARACGLDRDGGEEQLSDELLGRVVERVRPHRADGHGASWALLAAHHERLEELLDDGPDGGEGRELLARRGRGGAGADAAPLRAGGAGPWPRPGADGAGRRLASRAPSARSTSGRWACSSTRRPGRRRVVHALIFTAVLLAGTASCG